MCPPSQSHLDGVVRLLIGPGGSSGDGEEELEADQGNVSPGEGILALEKIFMRTFFS